MRRKALILIFAQLANVSQIIYSPIILATKLSILLLYLRVFSPNSKTYTAIHILLWANIGFYTAGLFVVIFQCNPREKAYMGALPGTCIDQHAALLSSAIFNTISDFAILLLPAGTIWGLQIPRARKIGILEIFGTGLLYENIVSITIFSWTDFQQRLRCEYHPPCRSGKRKWL